MIGQIFKNKLREYGYDIVKYNNTHDDRDLYYKYYALDSIEKMRFYNISAGGHFGFGGDFSHPFWTNIDVDRDYPHPPQYNPELGISYDPFDLKELPIESNSAEIFHSRFAIEHITDEAARFMFKEIKRCLKKNGIFRVIVPNFRLDYEAYLRKDLDYYFWTENFSKPDMMDLMKYKIPLKKASLQQVFLVHFASNASVIHEDGADSPINDDELDELFAINPYERAMDLCTGRCSLVKQKKYRQNHINWWDYEKLRTFLLEAGFSQCFFSSPGQSLSPVIRRNRNFDRLWNDVALYMEAVC